MHPVEILDALLVEHHEATMARMKIGAAGKRCLHHGPLACYGFCHRRGGPVLLDIIIGEAYGENLRNTAILQLGDIGA